MGEPSEYALRVKAAMESTDPPTTIRALADALEISPQAVGQLLRGATVFFRADKHSLAARALLVDPHWLATGQGEMRPPLLMAVTEEERELLLGWRDKRAAREGRHRLQPVVSTSGSDEALPAGVVMIPITERRQLAGKEVSRLPGDNSPRRRGSDTQPKGDTK